MHNVGKKRLIKWLTRILTTSGEKQSLKDQYDENKTSQVTKTQRGIRQPKSDTNSIVLGEK